MKRGVISEVRDLVPLRPLEFREALQIAELQAHRFRTMLKLDDPELPIQAIAELPRVKLTSVSPFPTSGASHWFGGQWLIVVSGSEPRTRQKFSAAHELKHVIDDRFVKLIYNQFPSSRRRKMIEQLCDYFAGALLMPRPLLKRYFCSGIQDPADLASLFGVSEAAIGVRLRQINLVDDPPRCSRWPVESGVVTLSQADQRVAA